MADINKPDLTNLWASDGAVIPPSPSKIQTGWVAEIPPHQWENYVQNRQDVALAYLLQKGVPEWDNTTEYIANKSVVTYGGNIYFAIQTSTNNNPSSSPSHWIPLEEKFADSLGLGTAATRDVGTGPNEVPTNSDLGTAATRDVGTASGNVMEVGAFGLGSEEPPEVADLNDANRCMFFRFASSAQNHPGATGDGAGITVGWLPPTIPDSFEGDIFQLATTRGGGDLWLRGADTADSNGNPNWGDWKNIMPLGVGQTWQDVTASRSFGVNYTNTTGRPILVIIDWLRVSTVSSGTDIVVGGVAVATLRRNSNADNSGNSTFIVPAGQTYALLGAAEGLEIRRWAELR